MLRGNEIVKMLKFGRNEVGLTNLQSIREAGIPNRSVQTCDGGVKPRRLTRRRASLGNGPDEELKARAIWATDPGRFAGLDEQWFEEHKFQVPERQSWAE